MNKSASLTYTHTSTEQIMKREKGRKEEEGF